MGNRPAYYTVNYGKMVSDFLCARPSRLTGIARLLDLFGVFQLYNVSRSPREADAHATFSDWVMVGGDLKRAIETYDQSCQPVEDHECIGAQP